MAHEETSSAPPVSAAPEMFSREQYDAACSERDQFKRQRDEALSAVDEQRKLLEDKEREVLIEQYTRKLEDLAQQGYEIGDRGTPQEPGRFTRMLDRIVDAPDSASEFDFLTSILARTPKRTQIDQTNAEQFTRPTEPDEDVKAKALIRARDRAISEKKPEMFARFLEEELKEVSP